MVYTIAYNAKCSAGWSDSKGNLCGDVVEIFDDKETAESIAADLNKKFGCPNCFGDYLTFFVEEMATEEDGSTDNV